VKILVRQQSLSAFCCSEDDAFDADSLAVLGGREGGSTNATNVAGHPRE